MYKLLISTWLVVPRGLPDIKYSLKVKFSWIFFVQVPGYVTEIGYIN